MVRPLTRVAIVAGEDSGDLLGAGLMAALQAQFPLCEFVGVGGSRMLALGFQSLYPMDRLAVMGLVEPLKRLPELLRMRRALREGFIANPPDVFIGIDAPDFNLGLELELKKSGIRTVHYVSPSVWAWRQGRIKKIKRAVDLMLTLLPFEAAFYQQHGVPVVFVGHPLADSIALEVDTQAARRSLRLEAQGRYLALLPGSRRSEVEKLGTVLLDAARLCADSDPHLQFLIPAANDARYQELELLLRQYESLPVTLYRGQSHTVMASADAVIMASGTTTLEAMLLKKPMVITYKLAALSFWLLKRVVKLQFVGLPNLLAGRRLVTELLQQDATAEKLSDAVMRYLRDPSLAADLVEDYRRIHLSLRKNASVSAAEAVVALCQAQ